MSSSRSKPPKWALDAAAEIMNAVDELVGRTSVSRAFARVGIAEPSRDIAAIDKARKKIWHKIAEALVRASDHGAPPGI